MDFQFDSAISFIPFSGVNKVRKTFQKETHHKPNNNNNTVYIVASNENDRNSI